MKYDIINMKYIYLESSSKYYKFIYIYKNK